MIPLNDEEIITKRISEIRSRVGEAEYKAGVQVGSVSVMAVTKTVAPELVNIAIRHGVSLLGENRVQEFLEKCDCFLKTKNGVHFIGHLQSNKVKYIIDKVNMIESVDSLSLADEINSRAKSMGIVMPVLLQVNISSEETKSGFLPTAVFEAAKRVEELEAISLRGLMCIPEKGNTLSGFKAIEDMFFNMKEMSLSNGSMEILSMGMSEDYEAAISCHSNLIRLGSAIFGKRNYP